MHVTSTATNGIVNADTIFTFNQEGDVVSASYQGGPIRMGHLIGVVSQGLLRFRFAQLGMDGSLHGGASECEIKLTGEGRLRLVEHFKWESQEGTGINIFEELLSSE